MAIKVSLYPGLRRMHAADQLLIGLWGRAQVDVCGKQPTHPYQYICLWRGRSRLHPYSNGMLSTRHIRFYS